MAENVSAVRIGEFGVCYLSLKSISPNHFDRDKSYEEDPHLENVFDQNTIHYSADGESFEQVASTKRRYVFGG